MSKPRVWFVDDLPSNLDTFRKNHGHAFDVETFTKTGDVFERIRHKDYPDALLCDLFFFDSIDEAQRAEKKLTELAQHLKQAALAAGVDCQRHALGITLMKDVSEECKGAPPFPMYAYSSKAPYLFGQHEWEDVYKFGSKVLLKGRVPPDVERALILADIANSKDGPARSGEVKRRSRAPIWVVLWAICAVFVTVIVGRLVRGAW